MAKTSKKTKVIPYIWRTENFQADEGVKLLQAKLLIDTESQAMEGFG